MALRRDEIESVPDEDELRAELCHLADLGRPWAIRAAAALGVADHLVFGGRHVEDLAAAAGVKVRPLQAVLRLLASNGIFHEVTAGCFTLTPLAELLCSTSGSSMLETLTGPLSERSNAAIGHLAFSLRTGGSAYEDLFGESLFAFCEGDGNAREDLDDALRDDANDIGRALAVTYNWTSLSHVVDVGGGAGLMLAWILGVHEHLSGTLLELPGAIAAAAEIIERAGVAERCRLEAGDFFAAVPAGGDRYMLANVLLNWDDESALAILANCRQAMGEGGRLLLIERLLAPGNVPHPTKCFDVQLLAVCGGMQRTSAELHELLAAAGLAPLQAISLTGGFILLEAAPGGQPAPAVR